MRTFLAVTLCLGLGACARSGGGESGPYGVYDLVSMNGVDLSEIDAHFSWELRPDGTSTLTSHVPDEPDPKPEDGTFSLGDLEGECFPFNLTGVGREAYTGSICGDVFTFKREDEFGVHLDMVLHKRR